MLISCTDLEKAVMAKLLNGGDSVLQDLRTQFGMCNVVKRQDTGVGFFTTFQVPPSAPRAAFGKTFSFGDVSAKISGLRHGAGFVLFVKNGLIDTLEGYCYDEVWPEHVSDFSLQYDQGESRDIEALKRAWS
ncbi:MAG TPA: hypothetical protein VMS17_05190 [Gemmataceae bacterium]|nr:hypothetical protein [Gemmataceae bacterium]